MNNIFLEISEKEIVSIILIDVGNSIKIDEKNVLDKWKFYN